MRLAEQTVVEPYLALVGVPGRDPVDIAFHLIAVRAGRARFAVGEVIAMHCGDLPRSVLVAAGALDHETVAQPHFVTGMEPEITLGRGLHEILALDPQLARERQRTLAEFRLLRMVRRKALL